MAIPLQCALRLDPALFAKHSADANYSALLRIYGSAMERAHNNANRTVLQAGAC